MKILVTGIAGFIGFHTATALLKRGNEVVGIDNLNDYYDTRLKEGRLTQLSATAAETNAKYHFIKGDLTNEDVIRHCFSEHRFDRVIHLAAQAGVRYSIVNPGAFVQSNLIAFVNLLEAVNNNKVSHFTYASSSSVYGANASFPSSESDGTNHPLQFYAATKRANELMAHSYSSLYDLPTTGLRFFSVYGPWSRPDMAMFKFTSKILNNEPIQVFNHNNHTRDFTYIDDIVEGVIRASDHIPVASEEFNPQRPDPSISNCPFRILNIGNGTPVSLNELISAIEKATGCVAIKEQLPQQPGDALDTHADTSALQKLVGYRPKISIEEGTKRFVQWYQDYYLKL